MKTRWSSDWTWKPTFQSKDVRRMGPSSATSPSTACQMGQFRVFCESRPRETLLLGLLVILGAARSTRVLQFDKRSGGYHTSFNHQRSTKSLAQAQKCMQTKWHDGLARTWKHISRHEHFRKNRYVGVFFFECRFKPHSVGGLFSNQRESISRCGPKSTFPSKIQNRQMARTSPLR